MVTKYRCSQKGTLKRHVAFIHEGKKPVKFVALSILVRGPKIDMSILFMKERNLSNFLQWRFSKDNFNKQFAFVYERKKPLKCQIWNYRCSQKGKLKRQIVFIHDGKEPLNTLTRNVALFMREKIPFNCQLCGETCFFS